jgi:hypothetical protein
VYQETGSTGGVALLMLVRLAPPILGGGAAAALVDGVRRERLLVLVELLRAAMLAAVVAATVAGFTVELPATNGLNGVIESTAMATGAIAGGALLALVGVVPALAVDLTTFLLAALLFAGIAAGAGTGA